MMDPVLRFEAVDEDGLRHVIQIFDMPPGPQGDPPAQRVLLTSRQQRVYRIAKGLYQFVATGIRLISDDPDAP